MKVKLAVKKCKKPYAKPEIVTEKVLDVLADACIPITKTLSCGKSTGCGFIAS